MVFYQQMTLQCRRSFLVSKIMSNVSFDTWFYTQKKKRSGFRIESQFCLKPSKTISVWRFPFSSSLYFLYTLGQSPMIIGWGSRARPDRAGGGHFVFILFYYRTCSKRSKSNKMSPPVIRARKSPPIVFLFFDHSTHHWSPPREPPRRAASPRLRLRLACRTT